MSVARRRRPRRPRWCGSRICMAASSGRSGSSRMATALSASRTCTPGIHSTKVCTWSDPLLLSRDAASAPTGGQTITTKGALIFVADNEKPTIFAPPVTSGPVVVITWNSAYCPQNPAAANNAGSYTNPDQGAGDFDGDRHARPAVPLRLGGNDDRSDAGLVGRASAHQRRARCDQRGDIRQFDRHRVRDGVAGGSRGIAARGRRGPRRWRHGVSRDRRNQHLVHACAESEWRDAARQHRPAE